MAACEHLFFRTDHFGGWFSKNYQSALNMKVLISLYPQNNVFFDYIFNPFQKFNKKQP